MLIQMLIAQPQAAVTIVQRTPVWVWGLLAGLLLLGAVQLRQRRIRPLRSLLMPLVLALFSLIGLGRDLSSGGWAGLAFGAWLLAAAAVLFATRRLGPPAGTRYEPGTGLIHLPGSPLPLMIIMAIFLLKYGMGVELALQPALTAQPAFALGLAATYGALSGLLAARSAALWRLVSDRTA
jgi:hypothetical protein